MGRSIPDESQKQVDLGLLSRVKAVVALYSTKLSKKCRKLSENLRSPPTSPMSCDVSYLHNVSSPKIAPKSPLSSPRALFTTLSNKTLPLLTKKKGNEEIGDQIHHETETETETETEEGLWQRKILMGEKCEPPDFSGVIYYDHMGNQLSQFPPKSPRREFSPTFSFPVLAQEGTVK